jgi:hypothetical protein
VTLIAVILVLILFAILYSTKRGRELLVKIIVLPFTILGWMVRGNPEKRFRMEMERTQREEQPQIEMFKKSLKGDELELINEEWLRPYRFDDIRAQLSIYKSFQRGETDWRYLKPEILATANGNNSLMYLKPEKIEALRKKLRHE